MRVLALALAVVLLGAGASDAAARGRDTVRIVRDARGEPHVRAKSPYGVSYGFAWAQMEDQADYILTNYAQALGRGAELLGPGCLPQCFVRDQLTHLFRVPESAGEKFDSLPRSTRTRLQGFADGIDDYVDAHRLELPAWAFHVTGADVLAASESRFVEAQVSDVLGAGGEDDSASNAFVLDGTRTASGKPLLEGDPHLPFDGDSRWYAAQLHYPGTRVEGVTFRGLPGIAMGSNGRVAWTHTANHGTQNETDRYVERLNPANPNQYLFGGAYRDMTVRNVVIEVQASPGVVTSVNVRMRYTVHGPVISDPFASPDGSQAAPATDTATSATVSQFEQVGLPTQLFAEEGARSLSEFRAALDQDQLSGFNVLAADRRGIFFAGASRSGILAPGLNPNRPLDGSDPATAWQGIVPFEQLPQATDPPQGYYQNANNAPWFSAPGQIEQADQPYFLRGGGNGTRSRRQVQLLDPLTNATIADAERIGLDTYVEIAPSLKALLAQTAFSATSDPRVREAWSLIGPWNNRASVDSTAYPLFATWLRGLNESALGFQVADPPPPTTTFTPAQRAEASRAMIVAYNGMKAQYGTIAKRYGDLHTYTYGSLTAPVNGGDFDVPTLHLTNCRNQAGSSSPVYYHPCSVRGGSSFVFNVDMATGRMTYMRPVSDTDDPASPFFTLNAADYVADRFRDLPVSGVQRRAERSSREVLQLPRSD